MANPFQQLIPETETPQEEDLTKVTTKSYVNPFQKIAPEFEESRARKIARWLYQIPSGIAQRFTYPLDLLQLLGTGEATDPEEIEQIRRISEQEGIPFDEKKYLQSVEKAASFFPTQSNIEKYLEERYDIPLQAKTRGQKLLKLGSLSGAVKKGGAVPRGAAAGAAPAVSAGLEQVGVPEELADIVGLGAAQFAPSKIGKRSQAADLERTLLEGVEGSPPPEGPPSSPFEIAEELKGTVGESPPPPPEKTPRPLYPGEEQRRGARSLENRITEGGENLGISIDTKPVPSEASLKENIGRTISPYEIHNSTNAGKTIRREVMRIDQAEYNEVNQLYNLSKNLNKNITDIHPELADSIMERIDELKKIPSKSAPTTQLLKSNEDLLKKLVAVDKEGNITGYKPISNQDLINQIQESRRIVDFDFAHGSPKNIFKPFIEEMQNSVINSAENQNPEAAKTFKEARTAYRNWSNTFDNDYMRPLRDLSNRDFKKMYKQSLDFDNFNVLRDVLERTPYGEEITNVLQREIVENELGNVGKKTPREIERSLREIEAVVSPDKVQEIRQTIKENQKRFPKRAKKIEKAQASQIDRRAADISKKTPEEIYRMMNSRSGIRELEKTFTTPQQKKVLNRLKQRKIQSILRENNIEKEFTGKQLYDVLNKEQNFELISELTSPEMAEELRTTAKEIADRKFTKENVKKVGKGLFKFKLLHTLLSL